MALIQADYFTDPLCSWSWGNEPRYRKLREEFGDQVAWRHRMGGLMKSLTAQFPLYEKTQGDLNDIAKHQEEVSRQTKMPIDAGFWRECPPFSTYPAAVAVKAVGLQGGDLEDAYLRRVREGFLTEKRRLDQKEDLLKLAAEVPGIDLSRLSLEIDGAAALKAFGEDWDLCRSPLPEARDTTKTQGYIRYCFPTLVLRNQSGRYRVLDVDHTYKNYLTALQELAPEMHRAAPPTIESFVRKYHRVAAQEVSVACEVPWEEAEQVLNEMARTGKIRRRPVGLFALWEQS